jgi:two-component system sensor histidine kinase KdpD
MVGVTAAPGTEILIRRASRMAARLKTDLHVVHVVNGKVGRRSRDGKLDELRRLVSEVGASWHELSGDDVVETLAVFARHHQITQIVVGASQRSRWQELKGGGSIVKRFTQLAASGEVDVHIIGRREAPTV